MAAWSFIGVFIVLPTAISPQTINISVWYSFYLILTVVMGVILSIGFWKMKKWAFYGYVTLFLTNQIIAKIMGVRSMENVTDALIWITIGAIYFRKMD